MADESVRPVITGEQYKLIASPIRIRILHVLAQGERTAAQVADEMGESRGNVHYHIQRLHAGGLIELTRTEPKGGVLERYYRAATTRFHLSSAGEGAPGRHVSMETWLSRSPDGIRVLLDVLDALLGAWEQRPSADPGGAQTWKVAIGFEREDDHNADARPPAPAGGAK